MKFEIPEQVDVQEPIYRDIEKARLWLDSLGVSRSSNVALMGEISSSLSKMNRARIEPEHRLALLELIHDTIWEQLEEAQRLWSGANQGTDEALSDQLFFDSYVQFLIEIAVGYRIAFRDTLARELQVHSYYRVLLYLSRYYLAYLLMYRAVHNTFWHFVHEIYRAFISREQFSALPDADGVPDTEVHAIYAQILLLSMSHLEAVDHTVYHVQDMVGALSSKLKLTRVGKVSDLQCTFAVDLQSNIGPLAVRLLQQNSDTQHEQAQLLDINIDGVLEDIQKYIDNASNPQQRIAFERLKVQVDGSMIQRAQERKQVQSAVSLIFGLPKIFELLSAVRTPAAAGDANANDNNDDDGLNFADLKLQELPDTTDPSAHIYATSVYRPKTGFQATVVEEVDPWNSSRGITSLQDSKKAAEESLPEIRDIDFDVDASEAEASGMQPTGSSTIDIPEETWEVFDRTESGYGMCFDFSPDNPVKFGELVAWRDVGADTDKWHIGILRWLRVSNDQKRALCGIECINADSMVEPVIASQRGGLAGALVSFNGLMLSPPDGLGESAVLVYGGENHLTTGLVTIEQHAKRVQYVSEHVEESNSVLARMRLRKSSGGNLSSGEYLDDESDNEDTSSWKLI